MFVCFLWTSILCRNGCPLIVRGTCLSSVLLLLFILRVTWRRLWALHLLLSLVSDLLIIDVNTFICRRFHNTVLSDGNTVNSADLMVLSLFCCLWVRVCFVISVSQKLALDTVFVLFFVIYDKWWIHIAWGCMWCIQSQTTQEKRHSCVDVFIFTVSLSDLYSVHINACCGIDALVSCDIIHQISMKPVSAME